MASFEPIPLLNKYKYGLSRRRFLQTLTGGLKLRKAPWYAHLIQLALWIAPLLLCLPFIILEGLGVWNEYYLATVYGCVMGGGVLVLGVAGACIRRHCAVDVPPVTDIQLDDEESVDFTSCCELAMFNFIFSKKKVHSLLLHPLVSGVFSFAGCVILFPGVLQETMHVAGVVVVFILGWFTLCNAHYSLSVAAPHETATYRATDPLELRFLMRPSYVMTTAAVFILVRILVSQSVVYLQLLYAVLCLLPMGWLLGVLAPLDALLPWLMEQTLVHLMGGSPLATDFKLLVMFTLSVVFVAIPAALTNRTASVLLATVFGYLLSQDIFSNLKALVCLLTSKCKPISSLTHPLWKGIFSKMFSSYCHLNCSPISGLNSYLVHLAVAAIEGTILLSISLVIVYFTFTRSEENLPITVVGSILIGLYVAVIVSDSLQGVYILGLFRNPLYPKHSGSTEKFKRWRKRLGYLSIPRRLTVAYISPLVMIAYVGLGLQRTGTTVIPHIWFGIAASRILRKIWQRTLMGHFELLVVAVLQLVLPPESSWAILGLGTQTLIVGTALEVTANFLQKLSFAAKHFVGFVSSTKQRTYLALNIVIVVSTILFLPLVLAILLASSVISAPLVPLFTLPIFFISFPRPRRFWPSLVNYGSSFSRNQDSIYYQQAEAEIARVLSSSISSGTVHAQPGSHFLVRFQDRLCFATILEVGYGFCTLIIRGLELQETSCHTVEASTVDDMFELAFDTESNRPCLKMWFNTHIFNTLCPVDSAVIHTYSDAHNVLTGIIDNPPALERFSGNLLKVLVWVLFHHLYPLRGNRGLNVSVHRILDSGFADVISAGKDTGETLQQQISSEIFLSNPSGHIDTANEDTFSWSDSISSTGGNLYPIESHSPKLNHATSFEVPGLIPEDRPVEPPHFAETTIYIDNDVVQPEMRPTEMAVAEPHLEKRCKGKTGVSNKIHPEDCKEKGSMPARWLKLPLGYSQINKLLKDFPQDWLKFIKEMNEKSDDSDTEQHFMKLVMVCFSLVDIPCSNQLHGKVSQTEPFNIYEGFCGEVPYSANSDWLTKDELLHSLVIKAYMYTVKLMYDEGSLGEVETSSELVEYLQHYDNECYIGREHESSWEGSILAQKQHLFSLGKDIEKDVYTAHVLTLQDEVVHIGQLNCEGVHAVWADLAFELLYLTNDDEERHSIQAHPSLLRNLTIQAADPPLGYFVYSSGTMRTPN